MARTAIVGSAVWVVGGAAITATTLLWIGDTAATERLTGEEPWRSASGTPWCVLCEG